MAAVADVEEAGVEAVASQQLAQEVLRTRELEDVAARVLVPHAALAPLRDVARIGQPHAEPHVGERHHERERAPRELAHRRGERGSRHRDRRGQRDVALAVGPERPLVLIGLRGPDERPADRRRAEGEARDPAPGRCRAGVGDVGGGAHDQRGPLHSRARLDPGLRERHELLVVALHRLRPAVVAPDPLEGEGRAEAAAVERMQRPRVEVGDEVQGDEARERARAGEPHHRLGPRRIGQRQRPRRGEDDDRQQQDRTGDRTGHVDQRQPRAVAETAEEAARPCDLLQHGGRLRRARPQLREHRQQHRREAPGADHREPGRRRRLRGTAARLLVTVVEHQLGQPRDREEHHGDGDRREHQSRRPRLEHLAPEVPARPQQEQEHPVEQDQRRQAQEEPHERVGDVGHEAARIGPGLRAAPDRVRERAVQRAIHERRERHADGEQRQPEEEQVEHQAEQDAIGEEQLAHAGRGHVGAAVAEVLLLGRPGVERRMVRIQQARIGVVVPWLLRSRLLLARPAVRDHAEPGGDVGPPETAARYFALPRIDCFCSAWSAPRLNAAERMPPPEQHTPTAFSSGVSMTPMNDGRGCGRSPVRNQRQPRLARLTSTGPGTLVSNPRSRARAFIPRLPGTAAQRWGRSRRG